MSNKNIITILIIAVLGLSWYIYKDRNIANRILLPNYTFSDSSTDDSYISAKGSWVSNTKLANIQTVDIFCFKASNDCRISDATLSNEGYLSSSSEYAEINTWNNREITTKPNRLACVEYTYKFDRINKTVTGYRRTISTTGICDGVNPGTMILRLDDGVKRLTESK